MNFSPPVYFVLLVLITCSCQQPEKNTGKFNAENFFSDRCLDERLTQWFVDFNLYQQEGHNLAEADKMAWEETEKHFRKCMDGQAFSGPMARSRMEKKQKY